MKVNLTPFSIYWFLFLILNVIYFIFPFLFFLLLPAVFVMILIWGICVFEIGRATIISSQTKWIIRVILAFLASLLTISINPIGMILLDFINWRHINSFADYFSKAYWIIFLIHMLLFWLGEEIGYFSQKGLFNMVKIISDSTCDLSAELAAQYDIDILPLHILLGDEEFEDGKTITPDEIYSWSDEHKTTPKTSAPSLAETIELFRPYVEEGREIVCFSISNSMSTSGNVMRLAAGELEAENRITVIDSANLSTGIGLLVIEAAIMAKNGHSASEIASVMETLKPNVRASFVVDTLTYLYRGGRCNAVAAMAGGVLKLHPKIVVENGAMDATKKYRGKINSVIMSYVKDMETDLKAARPDRVFITHSGCDAATVESVRSYLESLGVFHEILETRAGGVVSSHCGPGTLGVLFIAK